MSIEVRGELYIKDPHGFSRCFQWPAGFPNAKMELGG